MVRDMMTRKKILPEDLIQKTNLQQHNFMIAAINEIDERQKDVEDINTATTAEVATLKSDVVGLSQKHDDDIADLAQDIAAVPDVVRPIIVDSLDTHLKDVLVDDDMLRFSADKKAIFLQKNRRDGVTVDEQIPLSTRQNVGLVAPEDLQAIDGLTSRVTTLENSGITGELFYLNRDFSGMTDAVRTVHFNADIGKPPVTGDSVIDSQQKSWRYVITGASSFGWVEVPHLSIGGDLKAVKSANTDGKVYVESDNTCSVVGWNSVKNDISGNTSAIASHAGNMTNPHAVTKAQVGLGSYPTSPADLGISSATLTALDTKADKSELDTKADLSALTLKADKSELEWLINALVVPMSYDELIATYTDKTTVIRTDIIDAVECTSLYQVFSGCTKLRVVTVIHTSNVTNMEYMFNNCPSLTSIPEMDTSSVTTMKNMFNNCPSLTSIPEMDTSSVTTMKNMFNYCSSLTSVPEMDTSSVTNMENMFRNCSSLTSVPEMDTSSVTNMANLFYECSLLTSVTFVGDTVPPYGTNMFYNTPIASGNGSIFVPDNMVSAYKAASGWSAHASVIKGISEK